MFKFIVYPLCSTGSRAGITEKEFPQWLPLRLMELGQEGMEGWIQNYLVDHPEHSLVIYLPLLFLFCLALLFFLLADPGRFGSVSDEYYYGYYDPDYWFRRERRRRRVAMVVFALVLIMIYFVLAYVGDT